MKTILLIGLMGISGWSTAQELTGKRFDRKGFVLGVAAGGSFIQLKFPGQVTKQAFSASFPNIKIGAMVSKRTALFVYLPGSIYTHTGPGRKRDRGFEGIVPSVQYWVKDRWWVMGGAGIGLDAPAFYDIKNEDERDFYFGSSALVGTGYELWRNGRCALDIQSRVQYGSAAVTGGPRTGLAVSVLIGFNWY